jgi:hypothetical protein
MGHGELSTVLKSYVPCRSSRVREREAYGEAGCLELSRFDDNQVRSEQSLADWEMVLKPLGVGYDRYQDDYPPLGVGRLNSEECGSVRLPLRRFRHWNS